MDQNKEKHKSKPSLLRSIFVAIRTRLSSWWEGFKSVWWRFIRWWRRWIKHLMAPDFWTYHSSEYAWQKKLAWYRAKRLMHRLANAAKRRRQRENERLSRLTYTERIAEEVERERAFIVSQLNYQRSLLPPADTPKKTAKDYIKMPFLFFWSVLRGLFRGFRLFIFVLRKLLLRFRRRWNRFKWFFFRLPIRQFHSTRYWAQKYVHHVLRRKIRIPAARKVRKEMLQRLAKKELENMEWKEMALMSFDARLTYQVEKNRKAVQAKYDQMRLITVLNWEDRLKRWLARPFKQLYSFLYRRVLRRWFLFAEWFIFWLRLRYVRTKGRYRRVRDWIKLEMFYRRFYNRVFLSESWVEAKPYSRIALFKALRKILFFVFVFINLFINALLLLAWGLGGKYVILGVPVNFTWDIFLLWMFISHLVGPFLDWIFCPGGFREVIERMYWWVVDLWTPDPYGGVYQKMLKEREKEQKRRIRAIRRQRIKEGLEHTWWRLAWLYTIFGWEYFVGLLRFAGDLCEGVVFDLRRHVIRAWKNRYALAKAFWAWVSWWAWRATRPFRRLRTWWHMRKNR